MKHVLTAFMVLLGISIGTAKADGVSFMYLIGTDSVNVNLDFSRLKTPENYEEKFSVLLERDGDLWRENFLKEMNDSNERWHLTFGTFNSRYTLLVQFISAGSNASIRAMFRIIDMHTVSEVYAQVIECRGGLYGGFEELFGESVQRLGEEIGDIIKDNMGEK